MIRDRGVAVGAAQALGSEQRLDPGRQRVAEIVGEGDLQTTRGPTEPVEVLGELGRAATTGAKGLEHAVTELEPAIERGEVR